MSSVQAFHQYCLQPKLSNMEHLQVTGVRFDVFDIGLFSAADSVCFGAASVVSDVTGDGDEIPTTMVAHSMVVAPGVLFG